MENTNATKKKGKKEKGYKVIFAKGFQKSFDKCFSSNPIYSIPRFFSTVRCEIRWAWQRVFRGYDDRWYWALYDQLDFIIPKCVRSMKHGIGCPGNLYDEKKKDSECHKWHAILEKIAVGFESHGKITMKNLYKGKEFEKLHKQYEEGMELFVKHFESLWD